MLASWRMIRRLVVVSLVAFSSACATTQPENAERDLVAQGNQYARDGLLREAADAYRKALAKQPDNMTASRNLGMVLVKTGDYRVATQHLEKALTKFENDFDTNFYLAEALRSQDQYAKAIFHYQSALKIRENDAKASKALAWSFYKIRFYSEALSLARRVSNQRPDDEQAAIILARTQLRLKRTGEALATLRRVSEKASRQSLPYFRSVEGDIHYESGDRTRAEESYRAALKDQPLLASALLGLGKIMLDQGKPAGAIPWLERAVRVRPQLTEAHLMLGRAFETTDVRKAIRHYQTFRKQAATDPEFVDELASVRQKLGTLRNTGNSTSR